MGRQRGERGVKTQMCNETLKTVETKLLLIGIMITLNVDVQRNQFPFISQVDTGIESKGSEE